jgi:phosphatidylglycerophosphate synthase
MGNNSVMNNLYILLAGFKSAVAEIFGFNKKKLLAFIFVNAVTASRFVLGKVAFDYAGKQEHIAVFLALNAAFFSDMIDGWLAAKLDCKSRFGYYHDKLADFSCQVFAYWGLWLVLPKIFFVIIFAPWFVVWASRFVFKPDSALQKMSEGISPIYYIVLIIFLEIIYSYLAFGLLAFLVYLAGIGIAYFVYSFKKKRVAEWTKLIIQ